MDIVGLAYRLGPNAVRDLVGGTWGIATCATGFLAGCAFSSVGTFVWFGYFGMLGVVSLLTSVPLLRSLSAARVDAATESVVLRKAA